MTKVIQRSEDLAPGIGNVCWMVKAMASPIVRWLRSHPVAVQWGFVDENFIRKDGAMVVHSRELG